MNTRLLGYLSGLLLSLLLLPAARAQGPYARWDFGSQAALYFGPDSVQALSNSRIQSDEACATICDDQGNLLFYGNGEQLWNRQHQPLSNGQPLGGHIGAAQGCLIIGNPGQVGRYYVFTLDAFENQLANRLRLAEVDMAGAGGLGEVVRKQVPVLPDTLLQRFGTTQVVEEMTAVRHANGRDYWLVTHLYYSNAFVSVLISPNVAPGSRCVVSAVGRQVGIRGFSNPYLPGGSMAASRDGRRLAYSQAVLGTELYDFDPATGRVSNPLPLQLPASVARTNLGAYHYGAVFSADGGMLYTSLVFPDNNANFLQPNVFVLQYALQPGGAGAAQSGQVVHASPEVARQVRMLRGLQRGPDGLIYVSVNDGRRLDVIRQPAVRGAGCQYTMNGRWLAPGRTAKMNLPALPNDVFYPALTLSAEPCRGLAQQLRVGGGALGVLGDTLLWQLGDGRVVQTTQPVLAHAYASPGAYTVTVQLLRRGRPQATATRRLDVTLPLSVYLGPDTSLCASPTLLLRAGAQPSGTVYVWQDGSDAPELTVTAPGTYWLELHTPAGCTVRDSVVVRPADCRPLVPNVITPNGDGRNDFFVLKGLNPAEWRCQLYNRWGRLVYQAEQYDNGWGAAGQPTGVYYYLLTRRSSGQQLKGTVEVLR
jgi:gliding motility-associated-like protein